MVWVKTAAFLVFRQKLRNQKSTLLDFLHVVHINNWKISVKYNECENRALGLQNQARMLESSTLFVNDT